MNLNELTGYRGIPEIPLFKDATKEISSYTGIETRKKILGDFLNILKTRGYTPLGNGAFGIAFKSPHLDYVIKIFKNDAAYLAFVEYCLTRSSPHLPKFRGKPLSIDGEHFLVRMEMLTPYNQGNKLLLDISRMCEFFENGGSPSTIKSPIDKNIYRKHKSLFDVCYDLFKNTQYTYDIHEGNLMMRGDTIVIVDPYYQP